MPWLPRPSDDDSGLTPVIFRPLSTAPVRRPWYFVSVRWQAVLPLALMLTLAAALAAYLIIDAVARGADDAEQDRLLTTSRAVADRMEPLGLAHRREITRIAFTEHVAPLIATEDGRALHPLLEPLAHAAGLDVLLVTNADGIEIIGLQRVTGDDGQVDYAVSSGTDLSALAPVRSALTTPQAPPRSALARTGSGQALLTAAPVRAEGIPVGVIAAGTRLEHVLAALRGGDSAALTLYGPTGEFVRTTLPFDDTTLADLELAPETFAQALSTPGQVPLAAQTVNATSYNVAYLPLVIAGSPLGVVGVYVADEAFVLTAALRVLLSLLAGLLVGVVTVGVFAAMGRVARRVERVTHTAESLVAGDVAARTHMRPLDEVGELGATLDQVAERHQRRTDDLQAQLRRQRSETSHLYAVLESIPDGLVVQDLDGRVLLINETARTLLGGQRAFRAARLHELTALVTETLGPALAPGIYSLGDPTRIPLDERVLQAQAAAILVNNDQRMGEQRIGTVIVLRDITAEVEREQERERLLDELAESAIAPPPAESLSSLAREVARNTRALQRVITELRDLSTFEPRDLEAGQRQLALNDLLWNIAAEWQPLATVARTDLRVRFGPRGVFVLGDDRRLRWAIGNLIDNALKYAPPQTIIELSVRIDAVSDTVETAEIVVKDNGYGIAPADLEHAFTRFYRGNPRNYDGKPIRKPGTGQGLFIARRVIEAHGGAIQLTSRVGVGTTAIVRLPLTAPVSLEMPDDGASTGAAAIETDAAPGAVDATGIPDLPSTPYDTVPLEPRKLPWQRR